MTAFKSIDWLRRLFSREERALKSQCQGLTAAVHGNPEQTSEQGEPSQAALSTSTKLGDTESPYTLLPAGQSVKQPQAAFSPAKGKAKAAKKPAVSGQKGNTGKAPAKAKGKAAGPILAPGVKPAGGKDRSGRATDAVASSAKPAASIRLKSESGSPAMPKTEEPKAAEAALQPTMAENQPVAEHLPLQVAEKPKLMMLPLQPISRRKRMLSAGLVAGTLLLVGAITWGGHRYVQANTYEVFHVYMNNQEVGIVSDPQVVDDFKLSEYRKLAEKYPGLQMVLNTEGITVKAEKAFKPESDDSGTLTKLTPLLSSHAVGVELVVDGKSVGVLKDEKEADQLLESIKGDYIPASEKAKTASKVTTLAAPLAKATAGSALKKVEFVEKVELKPVDVQPGSFSNAATLLKTLKTGDVRPRTYKVASGDTLSFIAQKFDITTQDIQKKNPALKGDFIKEGQELNLTVLQPALTVRTVENAVETEEIAYGTQVIRDPNLKEGIVKKISAGKVGKKKVTFSLTKENGEVVKEELIKEEVLVKPVSEVIKRGTKVILGEGTGNFAWPVIGASLSSGFGYRWGKLHKGLDLVSSNRNILAADNGVVESTGFRYDYGNYVLINHKNGYKTMYGHMSKVNVSQGQIVEKGEKIGYMGSTGDSTGVHLHFEVITGGGVQNPLKYLNW